MSINPAVEQESQSGGGKKGDQQIDQQPASGRIAAEQSPEHGDELRPV